jgi:predicted nucleic acid-binding protein
VIVVDANIAVGWCLPGHRLTAASIAVRRTNEVIIAPDLLIAEVTNTLARLAGLSGPSVPLIESAIEQLPRWFAELVPAGRLRQAAFQLAVELNHPAYDCFYLALAAERQVSFATADARFIQRLRGTRFETLLQPVVP